MVTMRRLSVKAIIQASEKTHTHTHKSTSAAMPRFLTLRAAFGAISLFISFSLRLPTRTS